MERAPRRRAPPEWRTTEPIPRAPRLPLARKPTPLFCTLVLLASMAAPAAVRAAGDGGIENAKKSSPFLEKIGPMPTVDLRQEDGRPKNLTDLTEITKPDTDWLDPVEPEARRAELLALLMRAHDEELKVEFDAAALGFEQLADAVEDASYPAWRAARAWWRASDLVPESDLEARAEYLDKADYWAQIGIERDPGCAECMLWRYAALGRLATVRGILSAARNARTMKRLLNRGIELQPSRTEGENNSTLGNLYYASAVFNRMVPDSVWLRLIVGVRGDKEQALKDARHAVSLHPKRIDYQVELGAVLLCLGSTQAKDDAIAEGRHVLTDAASLAPLLPTDALDIEFARIMSEQPELACSFTRDGFVDVAKAAGKL